MLNLSPREAAAILLRAYSNIEARNLDSAKRDNNPVHHAADTSFAAFHVAASYAFAAGRKAIDKDALRRATTIREAAAAVSGAPDAVAAALRGALPKPLKTALVLGATAGIARIPKKYLAAASMRTLAGPIKFRFDSTNPDAVGWAAKHAAELVKDIAATTRQDIADAIVRAVDGDGISDNFDDILDAVGDSARAELIARTESMTAANEGQRQGWDQAVEDGLLPEDAKKVWIATSGCCDDCDDLDGEETTLDGEYPGDGDDGPPLHPNCRCTEGIA